MRVAGQQGLRNPPDPPTVEEIISVMRAVGDGPDGVRLRAVIVVLWRAGPRINEALALNETDLDPERESLLVRHGKGDKRREVGMDRWRWSHLTPWLELRTTLPVGTTVLRRARPDAGPAVRSSGPSSTCSSVTPATAPPSPTSTANTSTESSTDKPTRHNRRGGDRRLDSTRNLNRA
jgi:hypothetical protein